MLSSEFFFDVDHANTYLADSVVRLKGEPVWVANVNRKRGSKKYIAEVYLAGNEMRDPSVCDLDDLDLSPLPLGMCNTGGRYKGSVYMCRLNVRRWKVGLCSQNLNTFEIGIVRLEGPGILHTKGFRDTVVGEYPTYDEAYRTFKEDRNVTARAFSRSFSLMREGLEGTVVVNNVGKVIGKADEDGIRLSEQFHYLSQKLEQAGVRCSF